MYLLDTNVISEMRKLATRKADPGVAAWMESIGDAPLFISIITLMELERGVLRKERLDARQGAMLRHWFDHLVKAQFRQKTLYLDETTASLCAALHVPDKSPENDAWIGATALRHNLTLVTRNIRDFKDMGVRVLNPFTG